MNQTEYSILSPPTKPGIYFNLADPVYRAIKAVSQTTLKKFWDCPRRWTLEPEFVPTAAMKFGLLIDNMWLSRDTSRYVVQPATYETKGMRCPICGSITDSQKCAKCKVDRQQVNVQNAWSGNSNTCREWVAAQEAEGKEVVSGETWKMAEHACARLNSEPEIKLQRDRCDVQVAVLSIIEGVPVKTLIDMVPKQEFRKALGDLKVATTADPKEWAAYVYNNRLHWQAALILDLWNKESGESLEWFYHFVVESAEPHEPCMTPLSQDFIALGRRDYQRALRLWGECQEKQEFPGYPMNVPCEPKHWMTKEGAQ